MTEQNVQELDSRTKMAEGSIEINKSDIGNIILGSMLMQGCKKVERNNDMSCLRDLGGYSNHY